MTVMTVIDQQQVTLSIDKQKQSKQQASDKLHNLDRWSSSNQVASRLPA